MARVAGHGLSAACRAMVKAGLGFSDLNPIVMDRTRTEHWHGLGLPSRITNALIRDDILSADMLLALSTSDLRQIRLVGDDAIRMLAEAQQQLRDQAAEAGTPSKATE